MKPQSLSVPATISVSFAIAFSMLRMWAPWRLSDENRVSEVFCQSSGIPASEVLWQSSGIPEALSKRPTLSAVKIVAEITAVRDPLDVIPEIHAGDVITGTFIFDSHAVDDEFSEPDIGRYRFTKAPSGVILAVGRYTFGTDPGDVDFDIEVGNHEYGSSFSFMSRNNVCEPSLQNGDRTGRVGLVWWRLVDRPDTNLSDELPTEPSMPADWESLIGLRIEGTVTDVTSQLEESFLITAKVISTQALVP